MSTLRSQTILPPHLVAPSTKMNNNMSLTSSIAIFYAVYRPTTVRVAFLFTPLEPFFVLLHLTYFCPLALLLFLHFIIIIALPQLLTFSIHLSPIYGCFFLQLVLLHRASSTIFLSFFCRQHNRLSCFSRKKRTEYKEDSELREREPV